MQAVERPGALGYQVLAPLGKQAQYLGADLGIYGYQPRVARGGQSAVARASSPSFLRALPLERAPAPAQKRAWAARPPQTRQPLPTSPPGAYPKPADVLHRPTTLGEPLSPAFEGPQAFSRFCGNLACSTSSPLASSIAATATDALWGSTPIKTFMGHAPPFRSNLCAIGVREGHSDFGLVLPYLF